MERQVDPTSVQAEAQADRPTAMPASSSWQLASSEGRAQPPPAANGLVSSSAEWRPVQATPPLKFMQSTTKPAGHQQDRSLTTSEQSPSDAQTPKGPSVQTDDILGSADTESRQPKPLAASSQPGPIQESGTQTTSTEPVAGSRATRPKRPVLGFNGQALRGRQNGANSGPPPARLKSEGGQPAGNMINGIRRPGLNLNGRTTGTPATTTAAPQVAPSSGAESSANVGNAFQNRLANANQRLRNRFRHRNQPAPGASGGQDKGSLAPASQIAPEAVSLAPLSESGGSGAPPPGGGTGSIEQPLPGGSPERAVPAELSLVSSSTSQGPTSGPVVGSDDVLLSAASAANVEPIVNQPITAPSVGQSGEPDVSLEPVSAEQEAGLKALSRAGEQRPRDANPEGPKLLSGQLQQGQLSSVPLNFDTLFQNDQPAATSGHLESPSEHKVSHSAAREPSESKHNVRPALMKKNQNDKLNGWLDHHHNKFIPRPSGQHEQQSGHLSQQLAASLNQLTPSFVSNIPSETSSQALRSTPVSLAASGLPTETIRPVVGSLEEVSASEIRALNSTNASQLDSGDSEQIQLQTITKTYSTIMTSVKTRLVPLQVKSSTGIHTITESYVMTKMLTAYQTMPVGELILAEPLSTRAPFEMFNEMVAPDGGDKSSARQAPSIGASSSVGAGAPPVDTLEQPISLDTSPKSANDWLHDFTTGHDNNASPLDTVRSAQQQQQQQQSLATSLLEQQARDANNLAAGLGLASGEPLDQLASQLDPAALLADGTISIPDLNNPIVLAAAIQNPQLAAVILAAQQLQLKQRQNKVSPASQEHGTGLAAHHQPVVQLQPSYSTSLSTTVRPSTYTVRDTMYTTRLVSFKDGRAVRTRTVSEPGSVIEQVLTSMATEVTPITITIRPTGALAVPGATVGLAPAGGGGQPSSQATINNALFATQLASLLARRQQQLQPSLGAPNALLGAGAATPQQLLAIQQLINQQHQQQQARSQPSKQFQPNLQQLLQSMQQQQQPGAGGSAPPAAGAGGQAAGDRPPAPGAKPLGEGGPSGQAGGAPPTSPITTTLTSLQVRTYTVHNAFKTIYRTITSTQLITSTLFPGGAPRSTGLPTMG